jgi:general secretion pathway protein F
MTQSLAALLNAGLTVDRALAISAQLNARDATGSQLAQLAKAVRSGQTFADALTASGLALPGYYLSMVQAGELGGSLPSTMTRLGVLARKQLDIRERIRSALVYPTMLAGVVLLTLILLVAFVLPRFEALFSESDVALPWSTQVVLAIGNFTSRFWWLLLIAAIIGIGSIVSYVRSPKGRTRVDRWMLNSKWTFGVPAAIDTARMLQTLSTMIANGVPVANGLRIARGTLTNTVLREALDEVAQRVKAGESMTVALATVAVFPPHAVQLARVGEETGRLEDMLREAAVILDEDSQRSLERLLTLMVPLITITMGLLVAGLIGSVLVGLLSINELAF